MLCSFQVKSELDRVKTCVARLKEVELKNTEHPRVDQKAAKRFVASGLWEPGQPKIKEDSPQQGGDFHSFSRGSRGSRRPGRGSFRGGRGGSPYRGKSSPGVNSPDFQGAQGFKGSGGRKFRGPTEEELAEMGISPGKKAKKE